MSFNKGDDIISKLFGSILGADRNEDTVPSGSVDNTEDPDSDPEVIIIDAKDTNPKRILNSNSKWDDACRKYADGSIEEGLAW